MKVLITTSNSRLFVREFQEIGLTGIIISITTSAPTGWIFAYELFSFDNICTDLSAIQISQIVSFKEYQEEFVPTIEIT